MKNIFVILAVLLWIKKDFITKAQNRNRTLDFQGFKHASHRRIGSRNAHENNISSLPESISTLRKNRRRKPLRIEKPRVVNVAAHTQYFIELLTCENFVVSEKICRQIKKRTFDQMRFYYAGARVNTIHSVTYSKGALKDPVDYNEVAVVDPFPEATFGHFVFVFYIYNKTDEECHNINGLPKFPNSGICLTMAKRKSCRRLSPNSTEEEKIRKCEIDFLPLVYDGLRDKQGKTQRLECVEYVSNYGGCPKVLLPHNHNPPTAQTGTPQPQQSNAGIPSVCSDYGTCDYAIGIFGGWDNTTALSLQNKQRDNAHTVMNMLSRNGFSNEKTQIFYHDSFPHESYFAKKFSYQNGLPANNKTIILDLLQNLCTIPRCGDSLVLYLNSPTNSEGTIMLWDSNNNGKLDKTEGIRINELLRILSNCRSRHVFIFADQSYAGTLTSALRQRHNESGDEFGHVVLLASGGKREYSWNKEATNLWGKLKPTEAISEVIPKNTHRYRSAFTVTHHNRLAYKSTIYGEKIGRVQSMIKEFGGKDALDRLLRCKAIDGDTLIPFHLSHNEDYSGS